MSRTHKFLGGMAAALLNQGLTVLVGLALTPFLLKRLGQEEYGFWLLALRLVSYLALLDVGMLALVPREVAQARGNTTQNASVRTPHDVVAESVRILLLQTPLVALAVGTFWLLYPSAWQPLRLPLAVISVAFLVLFPARVFRATLQGLQDLAFIGLANTLCWLLYVIIVVGLVWQGHHLEALAFGWVAWQLALTVVCAIRLKRRHPEVFPRRLGRPDSQRMLEYFKRGGWISITRLSQILRQGADLLIIERVLGVAATVPYNVTSKLVFVSTNIPNLILSLALPGLAELKGRGDRARLADVIEALTQATLLLSGGFAVVILAANQGFVSWWVGHDLFSGQLFTVLIVTVMVLRHFQFIVNTTLFSLGRERRIALLRMGEGAIVMGGSIVAVHYIGPIGVPLGMLLGLLCCSLPVALVTLRSELDMPLRRQLRGHLPWACRFGLLAGAASAVPSLWVPTRIWEIAGLAIIVAALYLLLVGPLALQPPLRSYVVPRLPRLLKPR